MDRYLYLTLVVIIFLTEGYGKSVKSPVADVKDIYDQPYSCQCAASVENSTKALHDLGTVKVILLHHDKDAAMHDTSLGETSPCHALRHRCHKACVSAAGDLTRRIDEATLETLGYRLCMRHEQVTQHGGAHVYAHASLHAPHCSYHNDALKVSETATSICCGHTYIRPEPHSKSVKAYGWNPDCHATRYVLGY